MPVYFFLQVTRVIIYSILLPGRSGGLSPQEKKQKVGGVRYCKVFLPPELCFLLRSHRCLSP